MVVSGMKNVTTEDTLLQLKALTLEFPSCPIFRRPNAFNNNEIIPSYISSYNLLPSNKKTVILPVIFEVYVFFDVFLAVLIPGT